jgi:hypothetical protein
MFFLYEKEDFKQIEPPIRKGQSIFYAILCAGNTLLSFIHNLSIDCLDKEIGE